MNERERAAIGCAWTDDRPYEFLTDLIEIGDRFGGHPGERRAAELVAGALEDAGARDATVDAFDMTRWNRGGATLRLATPVEREFEAIGLPYTPAGEAAGELVDLGSGTPEDVEAADLDGAVALASATTPRSYGRFVHRMEKYGHAVEAGAVGFVFHNHVEGQLPPTGSLRFEREGEVPAVGVSRETGAWLAEYADRGGEVVLSVDASTEPGKSHNAHAVVGEATSTDRESGEPVGENGSSADGAGGEILLCAHHDAHDIAEGALDNGCGIAVVVAAARLLAAFDLDRPVRVAGVGSEEIGLLGANALAETLDTNDVAAVVNVDGAGRFRDLRAITHGSAHMRDLAERVSETAGQPISVEHRVHPWSDHWPFVRRGIPAIQLHSESGERGRGWGHTSADTRDKVDPRNLREHAILVALLVRALARTDPPRLDAGGVADRLRELSLEPGMRAAGIWPEGW